jgi:hypothetical protein
MKETHHVRHLKKLLAVTLVLLAGLAAPRPAVESRGQAGGEAAPGESWSLLSSPYIDENYDARPVVVHSVTTTSVKGPVITRVQVRNRSADALSSVRLRWYLSDERVPGVIVRQGETGELPVAGGIRAGGIGELEYDVVSFGALREELKTGGAGGGNFRIDVTVAAAKFGSGKSWAAPAEARLNYTARREPRFMPAAYGGRPPAPAVQGCANTTCRNIGWPPWVECGPTTSPTNCSVIYSPYTSCTVTHCG